MTSRIINSNTFGRLGRFQQIKRDLYKSKSGQVYLLGNGKVGGKGEGVLLLDKLNGVIGSYRVPLTLVVCDDFFNLAPQSTQHVADFNTLSRVKIAWLLRIMSDLGFSPEIAIRSSALIEDQIGRAAAGKFKTDFAAYDFMTHLEIEGFRDKVLGVINSAYSGEGLDFFVRCGYRDIPSMPTLVQSLVGERWGRYQEFFFPAMSGIVNSSFVNKIKVNAAFGLGLSSVQDDGLGLNYVFRHTWEPHSPEVEGRLNSHYLYALSLESGDIQFFWPEGAIQSALRHSYREEFRGLAEPEELLEIALRLEDQMGIPFDIEWAWLEPGFRYFHQARPLVKRKIIPRPQVDQSRLLLESDSVIGDAENKFYNKLLIIRDDGNSLYLVSSLLKEWMQKNPDTLIVLDTSVEREITRREIRKHLLPVSDAVVVFDQKEDYGNHHEGTSGLQHLALNCMDERKSVVYTADPSIFSRLVKMGKLEGLEGRSGSAVDVRVEFYGLDLPINLAASDEDRWGVIYF